MQPFDQLSGVASVGPNQLQAREAGYGFLEQQLGAVAVLDVRRMHDDGQQQPQSIYEYMPLATVDFLARVVTARPPFSAVFTDWLSMMADEGYGEVPAFHFALDDRGQRYVLEVPCSFHGWLRRPAVLQKQHHSPHKRGPKPRYPRLKVKNLPTLEVRNMVRYRDEFRKQPWEKFYIKDSTLGPVVWEAKAAPMYLKRDALPTWPHGLIVARNVLDPDEIKYFVSNAPVGTPLEVLLHVAFTRYQVEHCFEVEKGELGLDQFEVRNYTSLKRHLLLTAVSHLFLAKVHQKWRGEKPAPDGLPTSPGGRDAGAFAMADRAGSHELLGEGSRDHNRDPAAEPEVPAQPRESPQAAVA